jgi:HYR domain
MASTTSFGAQHCSGRAGGSPGFQRPALLFVALAAMVLASGAAAPFASDATAAVVQRSVAATGSVTCPPGDRVWSQDEPNCVPITCQAGTTRDQDSGECVSNTPAPTAEWSSFPSDPLVIEATSAAGARVSYEPATAHLGGTALTVTCSPAPGSQFALGTTTVSCSAPGVGGSFHVIVEDTTPPDVTVPADMTVAASGPSGAIVTFQASATDIVDASDPVSCPPGSGSTFQPGVTQVTCSATDTNGNTGTKSFSVTVTDSAPSLHLPDGPGAQATAAAGAVVTYTATATDTVDTSDPVSCSPASGSTFPVGQTTVSCSATNKAGLSAHGSFTVTVSPPNTPATGTGGGGGGGGGDGTGAGANEGGPAAAGNVAASVGGHGTSGGTCSTTGGNKAAGFTIGACRTASSSSNLLSLVIERQGNGTVTSSPAGIECGADCIAKFAPGTKIILHIKADPGFKLGNGKGTCATVCRVSLHSNREVTFRFTPLRQQVPLSLTRLAVSGPSASTHSPQLHVSGHVGAPMSVSLRLEPISSDSPALSRTLALGKGHFAHTLGLPATLMPGSYVLAVSGRSTAGPVASFDRRITIAAPRLGILQRDWITPVRDGKPESPIHGVRKLWAYFRFETPPSQTTKLEVTWYAPSGKASTSKTPAAVIETFAEAAKKLPDGTWRCVLSADGKPIATATAHLQ